MFNVASTSNVQCSMFNVQCCINKQEMQAAIYAGIDICVDLSAFLPSGRCAVRCVNDKCVSFAALEAVAPCDNLAEPSCAVIWPWRTYSSCTYEHIPTFFLFLCRSDLRTLRLSLRAPVARGGRT